jgi:hypothetical protein
MLCRKSRPVIIVTVVSLAGCSNPGARYYCPAVVTPAVVVEIRDAATGAPLANGAKGAVHDGAYVDSLTPYEGIGPDPNTLISLRAADERPGNYAIEITHAGYRTWTVAGVRAVDGACGVITRRISASLARAP